MRFPVFLAVTLAAGIAATVVVAQAPAPQTVFRAGVDLVQLDVSVLDQNRRPVHGLTAADFTVLEDGRPQQVVTFQPFDIPDPVIPKTAWLREVAPDVATNRVLNGRLVVIVINDVRMGGDYWTTATAGRVADKILDQLGPEDLTSVTYVKSNNKAQSFTTDRSLIRAAFSDIKSVVPPPYNTKGICRPDIDELVRVATALHTQPERRKTILFVSPGFNMRDPATHAVDSCTVDFLRAAQQWNINVYGVDPGRMLAGWGYAQMANSRVASATFNSRLDNLDGLTDLSESTGGRAILNTKDDNPEAEVPAIFDENGSYYLLGFQSTNPKDDRRFRTLEVKVNRPGVVVRTRTGYYPGTRADKPGKKKASDPNSPLEESVSGVLPLTETGLRMAAAPFALPDSRKAAIAIALDVREPTFQGGAEHVSVLAAAFDLEGASKAIERQTFDLTLSRDSDTGLRYAVLSRLDLPPGRYDLRLGTENAAGRRGSVFASIDVPDFAKAPLSLSGVVLDRTPMTNTTPPDGLATLLPVVPTAERIFATTDHVTAFLRIYQTGKRPVTMNATVLDDEDHTVFAQPSQLGPEAFTGARSADYRLDLPLSNLRAGPYLLTLDVSDGAKHTAQRQVRFEIREP